MLLLNNEQLNMGGGVEEGKNWVEKYDIKQDAQ